jgi:hypothetical protein
MKNLLLFTSVILLIIWGCKTKPPQKEVVEIQYTNLVYPKNLKNARDSFMWLLPRTESKILTSYIKNIQDSLRCLLSNRRDDSLMKYEPKPHKRDPKMDGCGTCPVRDAKKGDIQHNWVLEFFNGDSIYRSKANVSRVRYDIYSHGMLDYINLGIPETWLDSVVNSQIK